MSEKITIICDLRERASQVMSELLKLSTDKITIEILQEQLSVGDYQITDDIVIERKTLADLNASIIDGRIFDQLEDLLNIKRSALIIEGTIDYLDNSKGINKKAIVGLLTKIGIEYRIPIFFTKNQKETALFLYVIAKKEQLGNGNKENRLRFSKTKMSFSERQLFIMESFPDIGPTVAKSLLLEFKSIKNIANAEIKDLQKVSKMGPKKAEKIKYLFERSFCD
ncbi:MAG: ERCC4 domain-containing protein [Candidatus ainarchaeum sp.]|nr:ERCC4 domain-containing protein [Candidatus ainarchaeum sp.]